MLKRALLISVLIIIGLAAASYHFRLEIVSTLISIRANQVPIEPHREITWDRGPSSSDRPLSERPPNIIFILADDLGMNDISTFGGGIADGAVPTPNIDRLARNGVIFQQAYAGTATCAPSRAMLLTGRYPARHGFEFTPTVEGMPRIIQMMTEASNGHRPPAIINEENLRNAPIYDEQGLPGSEITLAEILRTAGYYTAHIGKWHLGRGAEFGPNAQGFDDSLLMANGLFLPEDHPDVVNAKLPFDPIDRALWAALRYAASFNESEWFEPGGYLTDYWTDESLKVIEANTHRPFFLYLAHWAVHTPLQATHTDYEAVGDIEPHRLRTYAAMVRSLDRSVGRILDKLEEEGLAENTIVVFSSDNGGAGYLGLREVNAPFRGWKTTFFEGGIRVPLFLQWPAQIPAGTTIDAPVAHIDVTPTLATAAGAALPNDRLIDGVDLMPFALGETDQERPHTTLHWQSGYYRVIRHLDWKMHVTEQPKLTLLYDLTTDPTEQYNLADERPEIVADLKARMEAHAATARPPLYPSVLEGPVSIDKPLNEPLEEGDLVISWPN